MRSSFEHMKTTALELVKHENHPLAFRLLDHYWPRAKTLEDLELLGTVSLKIGHISLAVECAEAVAGLCTTPEQAYTARVNLGKAYYRANQPEKALFYNKINLDMRPTDFEAVVSYAASLKLNGQRAESERVIDELKTQPWVTPEQLASLRITDTHPLLRAGKTADGIKWFLHTDRDRTTVFDLKGMRIWNGVITPGQTLYVNACGGAGDELINIRFFRHLKKLGMEPKLFSILHRPALAQVFRRNGVEVLVNEEEIDKHQPWTYLMNLPIDLGVEERDLWSGPYLTPADQPHTKLPGTKKLRIGVKCQGNPYFEQDIYRCIPFEQMLSVIPSDAEIYNFELEQTHERCYNLRAQIHSWDDTLDYLSQMDIVLSSCTSIIHAAASMGVPGIVCVPILEYYVWTSTHTDESTPWYSPSLRVLKQKTPRCWAAPLERAGQIIRTMQREKQKDDN
jgi:hypothetical protein